MGRGSERPPATVREEDLPTLQDGRSDEGDTSSPATVRNDPCFVNPGDVLKGRWVIERVIGTGGMGTVVAARHKGLGHEAAIKILVSSEPEARERFEREARAMATLSSKYTVRVHDVDLDGDMPFMVMDYLEGADLAHLAERGAPSIEEACLWMEQACEALEEAHALGIVHRDIKPQNLFLAKDPDGTSSIRVLDFGIARRTSGDGVDMATLTQAGAVVGTLAYMAPEQIRSSKNVDARTDIWSVGACLYRILAGVRPFDAKNHLQIVEGILFEEPPPLSSRRPDVPPAVEAVVMKCLRKLPEERYQSAKELRQALSAARALPPPQVTAPMPPGVVMAVRAAMQSSPSFAPPYPPSRAPMPSSPHGPVPPHVPGPMRAPAPSHAPVSQPHVALPVPSGPISSPRSRSGPPSTVRTRKEKLSVGVVVAFAVALALFLAGVVLAVLTALGPR